MMWPSSFQADDVLVAATDSVATQWACLSEVYQVAFIFFVVKYTIHYLEYFVILAFCGASLGSKKQ